MANLIVLDNTFKLWALNEAEDTVLIASYLKIKRYASKRCAEFREFEHWYFVKGSALPEKYLHLINSILLHRGLNAIKLHEGPASGYSYKRGPRKVRERARICSTLEGTS
ncbi:hypothetical protein [Methylorubrum zatmanii]|uniref:Uncharacterized protein n=1 Tax=Methylorubrum zatmanii TaxID=29429 RepID=A0ABW1WSM9_9HYPH|nr:hypothetical protein [Methylorubrum zatmanii]